MVGEACLPSNAYYPRTPDYTLCSGVHVCWSEHSDSSFVYGFMILDYGFGTMTATTFYRTIQKYLRHELELKWIKRLQTLSHLMITFTMKEIFLNCKFRCFSILDIKENVRNNPMVSAKMGNLNENKKLS